MVRVRIKLSLSSDWRPSARVRLDYDWTTPPGVDFVGQRITFTDEADARLAPVVRDLERTLPQQLAKLHLRRRIEQAWQSGFTVFELNGSNPAVWMQVTPQRLSYGGYRIVGGKLQVRLGMEALTRTFVGPRPTTPATTPLPRMAPVGAVGRLRFFIPVIADYAQLRPVLTRALMRRAQRQFDLPGVGPVTARFSNIDIYGTDGRQLAVGMDVAARVRGASEDTTGRLWITATPVKRPGSLDVAFSGLEVSGDTDGSGGDLLVALADSPGVSMAIAASLTQNFSRDFGELRGKIDRAIVDARQGDFIIRARIEDVETGALIAAGNGLYMPVWASGVARVEFRPR